MHSQLACPARPHTYQLNVGEGEGKRGYGEKQSPCHCPLSKWILWWLSKAMCDGGGGGGDQRRDDMNYGKDRL